MLQLRILVVDDNADAAMMHADFLRTLDHLVSEAYSGVQGLEKYKLYDPHLILLDIGMADMNGRELARHIRAQPGGDKVFIVAISGFGNPHDFALSTAAGIDLHLVKPVDTEQLASLLSGDLIRLKP